MEIGEPVRIYEPFQYPQRIECGCEVAYRPSDHATNPLFQYPQRIECGCEEEASFHFAREADTFSILSGSSAAASHLLALGMEPGPAVFQYPQRIEYGCE